MKTILRYAGGKSKAYNTISKYIDTNVTEIISPFIGGGSLEVRWNTKLNINIKAFDIFWHLTNFYNSLLNHKDKLLYELSLLEPNKEFYNEIKELLLCHYKTQELFKGYKTDYYKREPNYIDDITISAYYFYNFQLSYGPMFLGWLSSNYNQKKYNNLLKRIKNFSVNNFSVENKTFNEVIPYYNKSFLYLDPPYYLSNDTDNKMFKGIYPNPNFDLHHKSFQHNLLSTLLKDHKGKFILSYNNCKYIKELYKDFHFHYPEWNYSFSNGESRIGKHKTDNKPKKSHEILITNF